MCVLRNIMRRELDGACMESVRGDMDFGMEITNARVSKKDAMIAI